MKDLVVLVADLDMQEVIKVLLSSRNDALNIRKVSYEIERHIMRDSGVYTNPEDVLTALLNDEFLHCLVFLDYEGCGADTKISRVPPEKVAEEIKSKLVCKGWNKDRTEVIVFIPELEIWVWTNSPHTAKALGCEDYFKLKEELTEFFTKNTHKPERPKEAVEKIKERKRIRKQLPAIYKEIAEKVTLGSCQDESCIKFKNTLQKWFPREE